MIRNQLLQIEDNADVLFIFSQASALCIQAELFSHQHQSKKEKMFFYRTLKSHLYDLFKRNLKHFFIWLRSEPETLVVITQTQRHRSVLTVHVFLNYSAERHISPPAC